MDNNSITVLSLLIGLFGLIATLVGTYFTYISFVNPIIRFKKYLKKPKNWEYFQGVEQYLYFYRYKKYPNFQIVIDFSKEVVENFHEEWINDSLFPNKENNASYYIRLEAAGIVLSKELFVSLDGHNYFVPVPSIKIFQNGQKEFYYSEQQTRLADIIGKYHFGEGIYEFAKKQKRPILIKKS